MMDILLDIAGRQETAWTILAGAAAIMIVAGARASRTALLGDLFEDDDWL